MKISVFYSIEKFSSIILSIISSLCFSVIFFSLIDSLSSTFLSHVSIFMEDILLLGKCLQLILL